MLLTNLRFSAWKLHRIFCANESNSVVKPEQDPVVYYHSVRVPIQCPSHLSCSTLLWIIGNKVTDTTDRKAVHRETHSHTRDNLQIPVHLYKVHANTNKHKNSTYSELGFGIWANNHAGEKAQCFPLSHCASPPSILSCYICYMPNSPVSLLQLLLMA